jgi:hypothetical protein
MVSIHIYGCPVCEDGAFFFAVRRGAALYVFKNSKIQGFNDSGIRLLRFSAVAALPVSGVNSDDV